MEIGKIIAGLRADADLSQQALADALFISRDLVSKWETGRRRPEYQMIEKIAAVFGVPVDRLVDKDALIFGELSEIAAECGEMSEDTLTAVIADFLKGVSDFEAELFMQRYYFLLPTSDVARLFGLRENHVRSLLSRLRRKLRKWIKEKRI